MDKFESLCKKMHDTYLAKNHDYGDSFAKSCQEWGLVSPAIRMQDKLNRFKSLIRLDKDSTYQVREERIQDTLLDLANYAILTSLWLDDLSSNK